MLEYYLKWREQLLIPNWKEKSIQYKSPLFSLNIRGPFIGNRMEDGSVYNNWDNQPESPSQTHDFIKITFHRFLWELRSQNLCSNKNIYWNIFFSREMKMGILILATDKRGNFHLSCFTVQIFYRKKNSLVR